MLWPADPTVDLKVEIAFSSTPLATDPWPTAVDVSRFVRSVAPFRGSQSESARFNPGSMTVALNNGDRRFDPENTAGPHYGNIKPMKRIRVTASRSGVTLNVFTGWILGWRQEFGKTFGVTTVECTDGGYFVENGLLPGSAYAAEVLADNPIAYYPLQNGLAENRDAAVVDNLPMYPSQVVETGASAPNIGVPLGQPSGVYRRTMQSAQLPSAQPVAVEMWALIGGASTSYPVAGAVIGTGVNKSGMELTVSLIAGGPLGIALPRVAYYNPTASRYSAAFLSTNEPRPLPPGVHHLAAYADASNVYIVVDGEVWWSQALDVGTVATADATRIYAFAGDLDSGATGGVSHVAIYSTAPSLARLKTHYLAGLYAYGHPWGERGGERIGRILDGIGHPSNLRDISAGGTIHGPYLPGGRRAMQAIEEIVEAERGLLFFSADGKLTFRDRQWQWTSADLDGVTFSDDLTPGTIAYDGGSPNSNGIDTVYNVASVSYDGPDAITNRDQASIDAYGRSTESISAPTITSGDDASNLGKYVVRLKAEPRSTVPALVVKMHRGMATNFPLALGLELGDVVTVKRTPMRVGSETSLRYQITGIGHQIDKESWVATFYMSPSVPTAAEVPYLTLGDANRGKLGATAANLIPY